MALASADHAAWGRLARKQALLMPVDVEVAAVDDVSALGSAFGSGGNSGAVVVVALVVVVVVGSTCGTGPSVSGALLLAMGGYCTEGNFTTER